MLGLDARASWIRLAIAPQSLPVEILCSPFALALVAMIVSPSTAGLAMLALCAVAQALGDSWTTRTLRGRWIPARLLVATLLRPLVMGALHVRSLFTRKTIWRGRVAWMGQGSVIISHDESWESDEMLSDEAEQSYEFDQTLGPPVAAHAARATAPSPGTD